VRSDEPAESAMEKEWPPAWSVSFADMTTLLMCFFILWYALTVMKFPAELLRMKVKKELYVDAEEARKLWKAYEVFKETGLISGAESQAVSEGVVEETLKQRKIFAALLEFLEKNDLSRKVETRLRGNEIIISSRDNLFFDDGESNIRSADNLILRQVAFILKANLTALVRVEGHTDDTLIASYHRREYESNWALSAARAANVARYLIDKEGIEIPYPYRTVVMKNTKKRTRK